MIARSVVVERCTGYSRVRDAIAVALERSGLDAALAGRRVLLKPNVMKGAPPEACLGTHPAVVGALCELLRGRGCDVVVGESSGLLGFTDEVLGASGIATAVGGAGARLVNFDAGPFERLVLDGIGITVWVPRLLFEVDVVVQVPKLKTHTFMGLSAALKNLMGVLPGATKCRLHVALPDPHRFARAILALHRTLESRGVRLDAAVVDAVWALAGAGSRRSGPRDLGLVVAGRDLVAVDVACAEAAGLAPASIPILAAAAPRGVVPADAAPRAGTAMAPARPGLKDRWPLLHAAHYWLRARIVHPAHEPARCRDTGECRRVCPTRCLEERDGRLVAGPDCVGCFACHEVCPTGAMRLSVPRPLWSLFRRRSGDLDTGKVER